VGALKRDGQQNVLREGRETQGHSHRSHVHKKAPSAAETDTEKHQEIVPEQSTKFLKIASQDTVVSQKKGVAHQLHGGQARRKKIHADTIAIDIGRTGKKGPKGMFENVSQRLAIHTGKEATSRSQGIKAHKKDPGEQKPESRTHDHASRNSQKRLRKNLGAQKLETRTNDLASRNFRKELRLRAMRVEGHILQSSVQGKPQPANGRHR